MPLIRARTAGLLLMLALCGPLLTGCDDDDEKARQAKQAEAQHQAQLQQQLEAEQALRRQVEQEARWAQESANRWIFGLGAAGSLGGLVALLWGVHVGSRALARYREEPPHAQ